MNGSVSTVFLDFGAPVERNRAKSIVGLQVQYDEGKLKRSTIAQAVRRGIRMEGFVGEPKKAYGQGNA